jgi:hypothetical protein
VVINNDPTNTTKVAHVLYIDFHSGPVELIGSVNCMYVTLLVPEKSKKDIDKIVTLQSILILFEVYFEGCSFEVL